MKRYLSALVVLLALSSAACSSDDGGGGGEVFASTTEVDGATTTTGSDFPTTSAAPPTDTAACSGIPARASSPLPTQGAPLGDGHYFGLVSAVDKNAPSMKFDVAQLFTGAAAAKAAKEDGGEPDSDFYIRNNSPATRTLSLSKDAVLCIPTNPNQPTENSRVDIERFSTYAADGEPNGAWIDVDGGVVTRVDAEFLP